MIPRIPSGISSFDDMVSSNGTGGIPENTVTLVYGPPKVENPYSATNSCTTD